MVSVGDGVPERDSDNCSVKVPLAVRESDCDSVTVAEPVTDVETDGDIDAEWVMVAESSFEAETVISDESDSDIDRI